MNSNYLCTLYFDKSSVQLKDLLKTSQKMLGFSPELMTIYISTDKMFENISYDENFLLRILSENPLSIKLMNQSYNIESDNLWFRIKTEGDFISASWSNKNLNFLLTNDIYQFFRLPGFVAGYAYNNDDVFYQTNDAKTALKDNYPGRSKFTCGMQFMAAPIMWFGDSFFKNISKSKLLEFKKTSEIIPGILEIKLFDLYESPQNDENRSIQKYYWSFFDLESVIANFEKIYNSDPHQALRDFLSNKTSSKKKRN